ncbi:MAG TPA: hypothetical protein VKI61_04300 [Chitinophagaceae bacterium]|jgi:hypothetical protein|nr:hypothetical protein [Chitinophagaceae bacterium]
MEQKMNYSRDFLIDLLDGIIIEIHELASEYGSEERIKILSGLIRLIPKQLYVQSNTEDANFDMSCFAKKHPGLDLWIDKKHSEYLQWKENCRIMAEETD